MSIAFSDPSLEPSPTWTRIDNGLTRVASYTIDRGRQFELDRTDGGTASIVINDTDGTLDPTNAASPYYQGGTTPLEPLLQVSISRRNPVTGDWCSRFRGFVSDYDYVFDPSQRVNQLTISCVDIFEILNAIQMQPGVFGDTPPAASTGQVFFDNNTVGNGGRIDQIFGNAFIDSAFLVSFSGNVNLWETVYSPGESAMTALQEAADAEFPGVSNLYPDRFGRFVFHGREAKFDPSAVIAGATPGAWDWHQWKAGDGDAVSVSMSDTAQIREFSFNRGLSKIINSAFATPLNIADADLAGQLVQATTSIEFFGTRSWQAQNLLTKSGIATGNDAKTETKLFATYYIDNYAIPRNRVTNIAFRPVEPRDSRAAANWLLLSKVDISDSVAVSIFSPGGGGFDGELYFVEGVHEEVVGRIHDGRLDTDGYDDVTLRLDLSPRAYFDTNPFSDS